MRTPTTLICCLLFAPSFVHAAEEKVLVPQAQLAPVKGVDLGIADDETFRRPNSWSMLENVKSKHVERLLPTERLLGGDYSGPASRPGLSIAWRNAAQVEEVEVRVRNLGDQPGEGKIWVDVLDEGGTTLLRLEPPDELKTIRMPAFANGGRDGKIIRMKSSRDLNNIIDQFDRDKRRYDVRATVETTGPDANPSDNIKTKSWNVPHRVEPGYRNAFNYRFKNSDTKDVRVRWLFERTPYPDGWRIQGIPVSTAPFTIRAGQEIQGVLTFDAPKQIKEGAFLEARLSLIDAGNGKPWQQREWFQVYDTVPPTVTDYRLVVTEDRRVAIQALVADQGSGVLEATGVSTQYSTDGGLTWSQRAHNYKAGNFVIPTLFEAVLGPFAPGTDLQVRFTAKDTAGNSTSIIPNVAAAVIAPRGAEKLLDLATVFPRTQPNALFTIDPGPVDLGHVASQFSAAIANASNDREQVEAIATVLKGVPITETSRRMLLDAASNLARDDNKTVTAQRFSEIIGDLQAVQPQSAQALPLTLNRIEAPGATLLKITTLGLKLP